MRETVLKLPYDPADAMPQTVMHACYPVFLTGSMLTTSSLKEGQHLLEPPGSF